MFGRNSRQIFPVNSLQMNSDSFQDSFWVCEILRKNENWTLRWLDLRFCARWWFQRFSFFHPETRGRFPIWRIYFSDGWFNHQPVCVFSVFFSFVPCQTLICIARCLGSSIFCLVWESQVLERAHWVFLGRGGGKKKWRQYFSLVFFRDLSPINHSKEIFFQPPNKQISVKWNELPLERLFFWGLCRILGIFQALQPCFSPTPGVDTRCDPRNRHVRNSEWHGTPINGRK